MSVLAGRYRSSPGGPVRLSVWLLPGYRVCRSPCETSVITAALQAFGMFLHGLGVPLRVRRRPQKSVALTEDNRFGSGPGMAGFVV